MITPLAGVTKLKPGSATRPFFGIQPAIVDNEGNELEGPCEGNLCIKYPWPGIMRGVYRDQERFFNTYFAMFRGKYFTGDGARRDEEGYYWITGRVDDVINVSGHRFGTAEIESALVLHPAVAESAVIGIPHEITGQAIAAFVILNLDVKASHELRQELIAHVRKEIGPIATISKLIYVSEVPTTRSGKIMRRILRKLASGEMQDIGDTSTLANSAVVVQISDVIEKDTEGPEKEDADKS
jgi:acetyl-CoA synthetase